MNAKMHMLAMAFMGKTAEHLRKDHGKEPRAGNNHSTKRWNAARHMLAHDVPLRLGRK